MKLTDLFEAEAIDIYGADRSRESFDRMAAGAPKQAAFCFGRMNPPTIGHAELLKKTAEAAMNGEYYIFASKTNDKKDNPLPYDVKLSFLKEMFPEFASHIVDDPAIKTPLLAADWLYNKGIRAITMVAGSDRLPQYEKLMDAWNSEEVRTKFNREPCIITFVSSGEREDGAEGVAGVSASGARAAAKAGNFDLFKQTTGTDGDVAKRLFNAVRNGLGLESQQLQENVRPQQLGDLVNMQLGMEDADFWVEYRGSVDTIGRPSKQYGPKKLGIKVTRTDVLDPRYLYYVFEHLFNQGKFRQFAKGATNLVNLRVDDIKRIPIG